MIGYAIGFSKSCKICKENYKEFFMTFGITNYSSPLHEVYQLIYEIVKEIACSNNGNKESNEMILKLNF